MLTLLNTVLEMIGTLICVNYLFGKKYYFKIHDAVFLLVEIGIIETINYFGLSKGVTLLGYIGIYIYELTKFKCTIRKAMVNLILYVILGVFIQVVCSMVVFSLERWILMDILVIMVNLFMILIFLFTSKKNILFRMSKSVLSFERLIDIVMVICFAGTVYFIMVYKMQEYMRITDYIIFGVWTILILVLVVSWQREKFAKQAKEKELELHNTYSFVYEQLLESIRRKQHDFHNHITAIYSQHMLANDLEELISMQKKYCGEVMEDNRYSRLLSSGSPMLVAFLYSKFLEAEEKGCHVEYDIKIEQLQCLLPQYKLVEILGVLLDNAIEAVETRLTKNIFVNILETTDSITFSVKNSSRLYSRDEIVSFVQPGYTTKGEKRGIGLSKVVEILQQNDCELEVFCEKTPSHCIVFTFELKKI